MYWKLQKKTRIKKVVAPKRSHRITFSIASTARMYQMCDVNEIHLGGEFIAWNADFAYSEALFQLWGVHNVVSSNIYLGGMHPIQNEQIQKKISFNPAQWMWHIPE